MSLIFKQKGEFFTLGALGVVGVALLIKFVGGYVAVKGIKKVKRALNKPEVFVQYDFKEVPASMDVILEMLGHRAIVKGGSSSTYKIGTEYARNFKKTYNQPTVMINGKLHRCPQFRAGITKLWHYHVKVTDWDMEDPGNCTVQCVPTAVTKEHYAGVAEQETMKVAESSSQTEIVKGKYTYTRLPTATVAAASAA